MDFQEASQPRKAFDPLLDFVSDLVWALSEDGRRMVYLNRAAADIYGDVSQRLGAQDFLWLGAIHPEDKPGIIEQLALLESGGEFQLEFRVLNTAGRECWLAARFHRFPPAQGAEGYIGVLAHDITQQVRTEQQLGEARAIYESLVQSIPIRVFRKNRQGRLVFCNENYCKSLGKPLEQLIGKTDDDLFAPELASRYRHDDLQVLASGQPIHKIEEHPADDGTPSYVEVIKVPVKDARGNRIGIQGIFWDVSERMNAQKSLERAKELAESASQSKSEFLASVSHEIRTPLNGVIGMTELLLEATTDREQKEYLQIILQSGETLLDLINDLLDFSKIEAGKLDLELRPFDIVDLLADALRSMGVRAQAKNVELIADFDLPWTYRVLGDGPRLRQIVSNLLSNAIKFTSQGDVVFRLTEVQCVDGRATLQLEVRDSGIGIPAEKLELIFEKFEQADKSTTREYGGTGLGLAISSKLAEMMGARIQVESTPGQGSRFWLQVELPKVAEELHQEIPPDFSQRRGLLFCVNPQAAAPITRLLQRWNCQVAWADSRAAVGEILDDREHALDFAMVDLGWKSEGDADVLSLLRSSGRLGARPILLLGMGAPKSVDLAELGVEKLIKPIKPSDLLRRLAEMFQLPYAEQDPTTRHLRPGSDRPLRILLAEDNLVNQRLARTILENFGHQVTVVGDGMQAVEQATQEAFDLVLMDVEMPHLDGLEATRKIRQLEEEGQRLPIIALSAHTIQGFREQCLEAGMDDYLSKPLRKNLLVEVMERLTGHRSGTQPKPTRTPRRLVDWRQAFETVGGDRRLLLDLINVFLEESPRMLSELARALDARDLKSLTRTAHGLKGALTYLGARPAAQLALDLEQVVSLEPLDDLHRRLEKLRGAIANLTLELEKFKTREAQ